MAANRSMFKVTKKNGKVYNSVMFWYPRGRDQRNTICNNSEMNNLYYLLTKLNPQDYLQYAEIVIHKGTSIISEYIKGVNHRIDLQTAVNRENPMLNMAYQIGKNSHAGVQIFVKPLAVPSELTTQSTNYPRIYDGDFGFTNDQVDKYFREAMEHSARNQCHCEIRWFIVEVNKKEEKDESKEKTEERIGKLVAEKVSCLTTAASKNTESKKAPIINKWKKAARKATIFKLKHQPLSGLMTGAKIIPKVGAILATKAGVNLISKAMNVGGKTASKQSAKFGGKSIVKKIPIIGLGVGFVLSTARLVQGDYLGAFMELGSGAASIVPVYGTAASLAIDAGLVAYDLVA